MRDKPVLTEKQREVVAALSRGLTDKQIAQAFGVSHRTIFDHVELAKKRLAASNRAHAVAEAIRRGVIS